MGLERGKNAATQRKTQKGFDARPEEVEGSNKEKSTLSLMPIRTTSRKGRKEAVEIKT